MTVIFETEKLRQQINKWRENKESIAFVPTMGNLHDGHLSLVKIAQEKALRVVVSIYVNPLQFSPDEDFDSYPRTLDEDLEKLNQLGVDMIFTPDDSMLYPQGEQQSSYVDVPVLSQIIEGEFRPGFFKGVATVVLKLFNMVQPDIAVFGEKDYQQLLIIRRMVNDLCLPIEIIGGETLRETDGLAMSSRNRYLSANERANSGLLSEALLVFRNHIVQGDAITSAEETCFEFLHDNAFKVDYVTLRETSRLDEVSDDWLLDKSSIVKKELIILVAVKMGKTRLIDNIRFSL